MVIGLGGRRSGEGERRLEEELRGEREFLSRLIDSVPVMVTVYDPALDEVRVNREAERVLGWSNEDLRSIDIMEACYPDPAYREEVRRFMQSPGAGWRDLRVTARDGTIVESAWNNIRLTDDRQVGIGVDIRDRKRAEAQLLAAKEVAEQASFAKSQFLAVVSHELRTPLNAIMGFHDLLELEVAGPLTDGQRGYLGRIRAGADHLLGVIDEILSLALIDAGGDRVGISRVDVTELARNAAELIRPRAEAKGLRLHLPPGAARVEIETDPQKLRQILLNLISNAVKYTEEGEVRVEVHANGSDGHVRVEVVDTGVGIPAEDHDRVFEPFTQLDQSNTRTAGGTGLGLAVARRFTELLGGRLELQSEPGRGSRFILILPRDAG